MHGLPTIGTIGLGWFEVSGRSRVPSPPAITTAFTRVPPPALPCTTYARPATSGEREADPEEPERPVGVLADDDQEAERRVEQPGRRLAERG